VATGWLTGAGRSPLFDPVAPWLARLPADDWPDLDQLNAAVMPGMTTGGGQPLSFVPPVPAGKSFDAHYEVRVYRTGGVPTRGCNAHDFFNALAWLTFPRTKAAINRLHYGELAKQGHSSGVRGVARDVLTLLDEGGVIVASADDELSGLLRAFRWKQLFWERRQAVLERMRFYVLGHAILEKAVQPYKSMTAKAVLLPVPAAFMESPLAGQVVTADQLAADWLAGPDALASSRAVPPLPVMGVPGWHTGQDADFYEDVAVFRPGYR
jgi:hypothetical protein